MKINDKNIKEIFAEIPFPQKVVVVAGCAFLLYALLYIPLSFFTISWHTPEEPGPLTISNIKGVDGFMDPSLAINGDKSSAILAYTTTQRRDKRSKMPATEIHLAQSKPPYCSKWTAIRGGLESRTEEILGPDGITPVKSGTWRVETPSLIYDAADKGREWKLFAYRYFWADDVPLARLYNMIVMTTSPDNGFRWEQEKWLFSANRETPPPPYDALVERRLNELHPALSDVYFYSRPSAVMAGTDILMTLSAFVKGKDAVDRVVMIGSSDHGRTWQYLGTPLRQADLAKMGPYTNLAGATLVAQKSDIYLSAVLGDTRTSGLGTFILPFENLVKGTLKRDAKSGAPVILKHIPRMSSAPSPVGGGFATHQDECETGLITSEFSGLRQDFSLFKTMKRPVDR